MSTIVASVKWLFVVVGLTDIGSFIWSAGAMLVLICIILPSIVNAPTLDENEREVNGG